VNDRQRKVLLCAVIAAVIAGLFPPWNHTQSLAYRPTALKPAGYYFILDSPVPKSFSDCGVSLDMRRLFVEWVIIALVATIPFLTPRKPKGITSKGMEETKVKRPAPIPRESTKKEATGDNRRPLWTYNEPASEQTINPKLRLWWPSTGGWTTAIMRRVFGSRE